MDEFYLTAFKLLSTCRQLGMTIGPIPWDAIRTYAKDHQLDWHASRVFREVILSMDVAYLGWETDRRKRDEERRRMEAAQKRGR